MGGILSKTGTGEYNEILQSASCKKQRMLCIPDEDNPRLIPNLPDDISIQILARLPRIYYLNVKLVSRSWKNVVTEDKLLWHTFDPLSKKWQRLPPMPPVAKGEEPRKVLAGLANVIRNWLGRRDPLDRLPYCGCAISAVDGCLYVLGGFSRASVVKKEAGGFDVIKKAILNMSLRHQNHISAYREGNKRRMTSREA
ncbi:hypothetical protein IFM89_003621 [Coptis chinensis]|uniref:F-box domain-containing protein n=1 Tax=Coptis chinensis TaxID=261450 RepID=A0A835LGV7_9MAGN|nr:hypothetical protein IFM89_003621 [Coptis chinensis]